MFSMDGVDNIKKSHTRYYSSMTLSILFSVLKKCFSITHDIYAYTIISFVLFII